MKARSKLTSSRKRQRRSANVIITVLSDIPEDAILIVFRYVSFPDLCRIKSVCKFWLPHVDKAIAIRLGKKQFLTNGQLVKAVGEYCDYLRATGPGKVARDASFDTLVTIYGWPIGKWDVSQMKNFSNVFKFQFDFNECIGDWNVSNGTKFEYMFHSASSFDQDIGNWNVSKATSLEGMFSGASCFNRDLSNWITSNVTNMSYMFANASNFNGDVSNFDTSKVTNMDFVFCGAFSFNRDVSRWNTGRVETMLCTFRCASKFNQDIKGWDTSNVRIIGHMFDSATSFCQDLSSWDTNSLDAHYEYENVFQHVSSFPREYSPRFGFERYAGN